MSDITNRLPEDNIHRPANSNLDAELQREIDEALGDESLADIIDAESAVESASPSGDDILRGQVIAIHRDNIFVHLGPRGEGVLSVSQMGDDPLPKIGEAIEVVIESYKEDEGLLILSREGAIMAATWDSLETGQTLEGRVVALNKGGLELNINSIRAFMPISQIEIGRVEDLAPYVNKRLRCTVIEIDRRDEKVVVSRRALLQQEADEAQKLALESLTQGQKVIGTVTSIMPYGAFVDIGGGAEGLLHVSQMSYSRVEDPSHVVHEGQQLEVMVLGVDKEAGKISLGLKQTLADPWMGAEMKWPPGQIVDGVVTRLMDFGAFVELEKGVEGLAPISELTFERRVKHPGEILSEGQTVKLRVMSVDSTQRRISLSIKRVGEDPWIGATVRWAPDSIAEGKVTRLADFGAFVELAPGVEGLVHISELSNERVRSVGEAVKEGQTIQAKVLSVDEEARRISLSIKQLSASSDYADPFGDDAPPAEKSRRKKPLKGGLDGGGFGALAARYGIIERDDGDDQAE